MSLLECNNHPTVGLERCSIAEEQNKDLNIAFINIIEVLKQKIKKSLKGIYKNKTSNVKK